jgi:hypothetical protein
MRTRPSSFRTLKKEVLGRQEKDSVGRRIDMFWGELLPWPSGEVMGQDTCDPVCRVPIDTISDPPLMKSVVSLRNKARGGVQVLSWPRLHPHSCHNTLSILSPILTWRPLSSTPAPHSSNLAPSTLNYVTSSVFFSCSRLAFTLAPMTGEHSLKLPNFCWRIIYFRASIFPLVMLR